MSTMTYNVTMSTINNEEYEDNVTMSTINNEEYEYNVTMSTMHNEKNELHNVLNENNVYNILNCNSLYAMPKMKKTRTMLYSLYNIVFIVDMV